MDQVKSVITLRSGKVIEKPILEPCEKDDDTTKSLMSSPKCRSVKVINNPARPESNHKEVNCNNYK